MPKEPQRPDQKTLQPLVHEVRCVLQIVPPAEFLTEAVHELRQGINQDQSQIMFGVGQAVRCEEDDAHNDAEHGSSSQQRNPDGVLRLEQTIANESTH